MSTRMTRREFLRRSALLGAFVFRGVFIRQRASRRQNAW
jgi:hypothetical protein